MSKNQDLEKIVEKGNNNQKNNRKKNPFSRLGKIIGYSLLGLGTAAGIGLLSVYAGGKVYQNIQKEYMKKIPEIKQEYVISANHSHSEYSLDCETPLEDIVKGCLENGYEIWIITDHDNAEAFEQLYDYATSTDEIPEALEEIEFKPINSYTVKASWDKDADKDGKNDECYFPKGEEVSMLDDEGNDVHLVVIGEYIPESWQGVDETIKSCADKNVVVIVPHPAAGKMGAGLGTDKTIDYYPDGLVDALEVNTSFPWPLSIYFNGSVERKVEAYNKETGNNLSIVANPDAHIKGSYFWTGVTLLEKDYEKYGEKGFPEDDIVGYIKDCLENNKLSYIELEPHSWDSFWWLVRGFIGIDSKKTSD
ncbi:MAG: hypothetical protein PWQ87_808 [Candidatus Woesearchaeota archaeon]|nr:hypothetical protein [Candidatus Woesearchaeota archaeon]